MEVFLKHRCGVSLPPSPSDPPHVSPYDIEISLVVFPPKQTLQEYFRVSGTTFTPFVLSLIFPLHLPILLSPENYLPTSYLFLGLDTPPWQPRRNSCLKQNP